MSGDPQDRIIKAVVALMLGLVAAACMFVSVPADDAPTMDLFSLLFGAIAVGLAVDTLRGHITSASKGVAAAALILGLLFGGLGGLLVAQDNTGHVAQQR